MIEKELEEVEVIEAEEVEDVVEEPKTKRLGVYGKESLEEHGFTVENDMLEKIELSIMIKNTKGMTIDLYLSDRVYTTYDVKDNMGKILDLLRTLFAFDRRKVQNLSDIKNLPIRTFYKDGDLMGFGSHMVDQFVFISDLVNLGRGVEI